MVRTALIILALWPTLAGAAGVNLKAVTVSQLADVVFRAYLGRDYVVQPDVVAMEERLTVSLGEVSKDRAESVVRACSVG